MFIDSKEIIFPNCGTLGYVPPEALDKNKNRRPNFSFDLYGVGIILFNALTGTKAFWDDDQKAMLKNNKSGILDFSHPLFVSASSIGNLISKATHICPY
jgi:serine/threonine protein kinase